MNTTQDSIRFQCPHCQQPARVPSRHAGRRGKCHACRRVIQIPQAQAAWAPQPIAQPAQLQLAPQAAPQQPALGWDEIDLDRALAALPDAPLPSAQAPALGLQPRQPEARPRVPCVECGSLFSGEGMRCRSCARPASSSSSAGFAERSARRASPRARRGAIERDVSAEAHIRALAFWQMAPPVLLGIFALFSLSTLSAFAGVGVLTALPVFVAGYLPILAAFFALGYCLWTYQPWCRWANVAISGAWSLMIPFALFGLGANPLMLTCVLLGAAWHGGTLFLMITKGELFELSYSQAAARSPKPIPFWQSPLFYVPPVLILIAVVTVFKTVTALGALGAF